MAWRSSGRLTFRTRPLTILRVEHLPPTPPPAHSSPKKAFPWATFAAIVAGGVAVYALARKFAADPEVEHIERLASELEDDGALWSRGTSREARGHRSSTATSPTAIRN